MFLMKINTNDLNHDILVQEAGFHNHNLKNQDKFNTIIIRNKLNFNLYIINKKTNLLILSKNFLN